MALEEAQKFMAEFMSSDTWSDLVIHATRWDGTVNWQQSSIGEHLRKADAALTVGGWAPLDKTIERMRALHPEYTLERYDCTT